VLLSIAPFDFIQFDLYSAARFNLTLALAVPMMSLALAWTSHD
jgi:hypothetical protein